jgi:uncharacterized protein YjdB
MGDYNSTMNVGDKQLLSVTVLPIDATEQIITYSSSDTAVATVNSMGEITAVAVGTTKIAASCGGKSTSFDLTVQTEESTEVAVEELDLGDYESSMNPGDKQLLSVTVLPYNATDTIVTYTSSDTSVATINSMGRIVAVAVGTTKITASCGGKSAEFILKVKEKEDDTIAVTDIEISNHEDELKVDETLTLTTTVLPSDATDTTVTYKSSDENIATVNSSGEVKGISKGNVTITVSAGTITKTVNLEIIVATTMINLSNDYVVLKIGESEKVSATVFPSDASQGITYKSSDASIASVSSSGTITGNRAGNTSIIVSNGDLSAAVTVIVNSSESSSEEAMEELSGKESEEVPNIQYREVVNVSECDVVDQETLKYLYENSKNMLIVGEGYSIIIEGEKIVNYHNELITDIALSVLDGTEKEFIINDGNELCGDIILSIENADGKYLYLYNESKESYERIQTDNFENIRITKAGKYLISDKKKLSGGTFIIVSLAIGASIAVILMGVYIAVKKKYWFW